MQQKKQWYDNCMVFREPFVLHVTESVSQAVTMVLIETVIQATAPNN